MPHPSRLDRRSPCLTTLAAALLAAAAHAIPAHANQPAAAPGTTTQAPRILLADPGQDPRQPLRRTFVQGQTGAFQLELVSELHQKANDLDLPLQRMPQSRIELHTTVLQTHDDGSASIRFTIANAAIDEDTLAEVNPALAAAAQRDMDAIQGTEITYTVSATGILSNPGVILTAERPLPASAQGQLQQFQRALEQIVIPLPEEPVGLGARWRVSTPIDLGGVNATRTIEYRLLERHEGDRLEISFELTVVAPEQRVQNTNIPAGAELHLTELAGTGDGLGLLEPSAAVATRITWRVAVTRKHLYRIPVPGQRNPREDRLDFLSISATTATRLPNPTTEPGPKPRPEPEPQPE